MDENFNFIGLTEEILSNENDLIQILKQIETLRNREAATKDSTI